MSVVGVPDAEARAALATAGVPLVVVDPRRRPPEDVLSVGAANFLALLDRAAPAGHRGSPASAHRYGTILSVRMRATTPPGSLVKITGFPGAKVCLAKNSKAL